MPATVVAALVLVAACSRASLEPSEVNSGQSVSLSVGESARVSGTGDVIRVAAVNDSRCPSDVQCITAGDALVTLQFSGSGAERTETLTLVAPPRSASYHGIRVTLISVAPYPVSTRTGARQTVVLEIAR